MAMKTRTLKRRIIIREYDFTVMQAQALELYDRTYWTPLDYDTLEELKLMEILKGKSGPLTELANDFKQPRRIVYQLRDYLYDDRYYKWQVELDDDGYLCVQARKNTPKTRLGWGVFEKDLTSRI
jgi:hypothetical protein